jgi:hypothetical protein
LAYGFFESLKIRLVFFDLCVAVLSIPDFYISRNPYTFLLGMSMSKVINMISKLRFSPKFVLIVIYISDIIPFIMSFILLILIALVIFAFIGLDLYGDIERDRPVPGDSFFHLLPFENNYYSFFTCLQILCGNNWSDIMYKIIHLKGSLHFMFFLGIVILGRYVL